MKTFSTIYWANLKPKGIERGRERERDGDNNREGQREGEREIKNNGGIDIEGRWAIYPLFCKKVLLTIIG